MLQKLDVKYVHYYTDGSTAKKLLPAFPAVKSSLPRARRMKRMKVYIDPVAILGIVVAVSMLILMLAGVAQLRNAQKENLQMDSYVELLTEKNAQLRQEYKDSYDLTEVEQMALAMGMVPQENVPRITISVPLPQQPEQVTLWQQIGTFLTGLFA